MSPEHRINYEALLRISPEGAPMAVLQYLKSNGGNISDAGANLDPCRPIFSDCVFALLPLLRFCHALTLGTSSLSALVVGGHGDRIERASCHHAFAVRPCQKQNLPRKHGRARMDGFGAWVTRSHEELEGISGVKAPLRFDPCGRLPPSMLAHQPLNAGG